MNAPLSLADFQRLTPIVRTELVDGLSAAIDAVSAIAPASHAFLRYQWFAAAVGAYGGHPRTLVAYEDGDPVLALPFVGLGPRALGLAAIPGSYWPFRSFALAEGADDATLGATLDTLGGAVRGLRIGPVYDDDPAATALLAAARARGWATIDRPVAVSWVLDLRQPDWPRGSTLKKNRFHEKHLAGHGALDWSFVHGGDWPDAFADLGTVEAASWIAARTDGSDAKFTAGGHLDFWRAAASDPVLAAMFSAALLRIDGRPAAFSFDIDCGDLRYAVANSYDPAIAKHSPGRLLQYRNLVVARDAGIARVDWGAGDSGYKQGIGAVQGPAIRDWLLLRPGIAAMLGRLAAPWWRRSGQAATTAD